MTSVMCYLKTIFLNNHFSLTLILQDVTKKPVKLEVCLEAALPKYLMTFCYG